MNAENAPNERQSRLVFGCVKLKAKMMKTTELISTKLQSPYADIVLTSSSLLAAAVTVLTVPLMSAVHKEVHQWTCEQQQIWQDAEQVCAMFGEQKEANERQERQQNKSSS